MTPAPNRRRLDALLVVVALVILAAIVPIPLAPPELALVAILGALAVLLLWPSAAARDAWRRNHRP